jgi:putative ABC transport system permease protein
MFYFTYLRRELRRRMRQYIFIGLGLAIGIGLVITVIGASAGVKAAQDKVLRSLYGIGTDLTVTMTPQAAGTGNGFSSIRTTPSGTEECSNNVCHKVTGNAVNQLNNPTEGTFSAATVAEIARLHDVTTAIGGLNLTDNHTPLPSAGSSSMPFPSTFTVYGTNLSDRQLGPISDTQLISGKNFTSADANSDVALVDSDYATANKLKTGDTIDVGGTTFKIIGIVEQPASSTPPDVYIPLARAQALATGITTGKSLTGDVDTVYVTAASASDIATVQREIQRLLPSATVTSSASLANEITGSLASAAKIINELGKWLAIMVLIAAFAIASLLTMAAVSRRVQEFGTLKAVGWRGGRIVSQVIGESVVTGICGGIAGTGLGIAGIAIINAVAIPLSATPPSSTGGTGQVVYGSANGVAHQIAPAATSHAISVPLSASVTGTAILLAVLLAVAGGLLAGSFGGWRAARLRPADALTKVA